MPFLRWISLLAAIVVFCVVVAANWRRARTTDEHSLRLARRLTWGASGAFALGRIAYAFAAVAGCGAVAAAGPEDKTAVLAAALEEPARFLRWSFACFLSSCVGLAVLRFRVAHAPVAASPPAHGSPGT